MKFRGGGGEVGDILGTFIKHEMFKHLCLQNNSVVKFLSHLNPFQN